MKEIRAVPGQIHEKVAERRMMETEGESTAQETEALSREASLLVSILAVLGGIASTRRLFDGLAAQFMSRTLTDADYEAAFTGLLDEKSVTDIAKQWVNGPDSKASSLSQKQYIQGLFQFILRRVPSDDELTDYDKKLTDGTLTRDSLFDAVWKLAQNSGEQPLSMVLNNPFQLYTSRFIDARIDLLPMVFDLNKRFAEIPIQITMDRVRDRLQQITDLAVQREKAVKITANVLTNIPDLNLNWQKAYANLQSVRTAQNDAGLIEGQLSVERFLEAADYEAFQNASGRLLDFAGLVNSMEEIWKRIQAATDALDIAALDLVLRRESDALAAMESQFSIIYQSHASDPRFIDLAKSLEQLKKQSLDILDKKAGLMGKIQSALDAQKRLGAEKTVMEALLADMKTQDNAYVRGEILRFARQLLGQSELSWQGLKATTDQYPNFGFVVPILSDSSQQLDQIRTLAASIEESFNERLIAAKSGVQAVEAAQKEAASMAVLADLAQATQDPAGMRMILRILDAELGKLNDLKAGMESAVAGNPSDLALAGNFDKFKVVLNLALTAKNSALSAASQKNISLTEADSNETQMTALEGIMQAAAAVMGGAGLTAAQIAGFTVLTD